MPDFVDVAGVAEPDAKKAGLLEIRDMTVRFGNFTALDRVSLTVRGGETVGLVGESGSGKSTLARAVVQLTRPDAGSMMLDGENVLRANGQQLRRFRRRVQMVFQDPTASLDPRMSIGDSLAEGVAMRAAMQGKALRNEIGRLLELVHLPEDLAARFPHEVSGGQRQRVAIARAVAVQPELLVLDEVTSALDLSAQAVVLNILRELQRDSGMSFIFISHNMATVRYMSERIAVMYLGRIVELAEATAFFKAPQHPYSRALLSAVPSIDGPLVSSEIIGEQADPRRPPPGCRYHPRCAVGPAVLPERSLCIHSDPQTLMQPGLPGAACHFRIA